jgi:hypothetical protein
MSRYHKIQTVYLRDPETKFKTLLDGQFAEPEFGLLRDAEWVWTEKVDGTNVRVIWDGESLEFRGRSDNAQMPPHLLAALRDLFGEGERFSKGQPITLYGEGYGEKIQKGGNYLVGRCSFILFDAFAGMWMIRESVEEIAREHRVKVAPVVGRGTLDEMVSFVQSKPRSTIAEEDCEMEGVVARPAVELLSRTGRRVITKLKARDFR